MQIAKTKLVSTAYKPGQYTPQPLREVAVVGRSNAGKSSLVNTICNNKKVRELSYWLCRYKNTILINSSH